MGYEELNDHDELRHDPLRTVLVGTTDPLGQERVRRGDKGKALAGKRTLKRLEFTPVNTHLRDCGDGVIARHPAPLPS